MPNCGPGGARHPILGVGPVDEPSSSEDEITLSRHEVYDVMAL